jgi:hypothetical protein
MSLFEYLMVMVSIMLGLRATQILRGFSKIAQSPQAFLPLTMWAAVLFYIYLQFWWALWDLNTVQVWNQLQFYFLVALPCTLFAATELLLPLGSSANTDWKGHFLSVQKWFFGVFFVFIVLSAMHTYVFLDVPLTHPYRAIQGIAVGILIAGYFAKQARTHVWLSSSLFGLVLISQIMFRFLPGLD